MLPAQGTAALWYLHWPSVLLGVLIYALIGRLILSAALQADNPLMRLFTVITDPVVKPTRAITPGIVPAALVVIFAMGWLFAARVALFLAMAASGVRLAAG